MAFQVGRVRLCSQRRQRWLADPGQLPLGGLAAFVLVGAQLLDQADQARFQSGSRVGVSAFTPVPA